MVRVMKTILLERDFSSYVAEASLESHPFVGREPDESSARPVLFFWKRVLRKTPVPRGGYDFYSLDGMNACHDFIMVTGQ